MKKISFHLLIFLLSIILTVIFTWPFIIKIPTFYYDRGDYQLSTAYMAYNFRSLQSGKIFNPKEYFTGFQFYPQPHTLVYSDLRLLPTFIFGPLFWITNNIIFSSNLTTFLTFVLSFLTSFYTLLYIFKNKLAALIGALVYTFNPLTFSRFPEHFELLNKYVLPLVFLFTYRFLTLPNLKDALFLGLFITLNAFSSIYFQIFTFLALPIFILPFLLFKIIQKDILFFSKFLKFVPFVLIFLPLIFYFDKAYLQFSHDENVKRSLLENSFYSARLLDYLSSTPQNWLYGEMVKNSEKSRAPRVEGNAYGAFNYQEHTLFLNIIPTLLFLFALAYMVTRWKKNVFKKEQKIWFISLLGLGVTFFLITLGPFYQGINNNNGSFKLPLYYLYQLIPFFQGIRAPTRALFIFYIPFALMVTFGVYQLIKNIKNKYYLFMIILIIITLLWLESFTPQPNSLSNYNQASPMVKKINQLKTKDNFPDLTDKKTLHFPVITPFNDFESSYLIWGALTSEKVMNGNRGSYLPNEQAIFLNNFNNALDYESLKKLTALKVDYLIFHKDLMTDYSKYQIFSADYQDKIAYEDENILILDINKYQFTITFCQFKDLEISSHLAKLTYEGQDMELPVVVLKNKSDCYLPSVYQDKYKSQELYVNLLKKKTYLKLPPVIKPDQEIIFSEIYNNLKWE